MVNIKLATKETCPNQTH